MKVILSGATGFIGGEVLTQALSYPSITSLICLSRRALPESVTANPKVNVIIVSDFMSYPPETLAQLEGAEACIWYVYNAITLFSSFSPAVQPTEADSDRALGSPAHKNPNLEDCRKIEIGYTLAAAEAFTKSLAPPLKADGKTFRFVYLSGMLANRDQKKTPWFMPNARNIKGEVENGLLALQQKEGSNLELSIIRPGGVLAKATAVPDLLVGATMSIKVDELASAMIDEAVTNEKGTRTFECAALRNRGRALLKERK